MRYGVLLALLLAGCAPQLMWTKDGGSEDQFQRDGRECEFEAAKAVQTADPSLHSIFGQELDKSYRKRDVIIACMRAKGYELQQRTLAAAPQKCRSFDQVADNKWLPVDAPCPK